MAKLELTCPHCKRNFIYLSKSGICKPAGAFFDAKTAELVAEKLKECGIEFGVLKEVKENDE